MRKEWNTLKKLNVLPINSCSFLQVVVECSFHCRDAPYIYGAFLTDYSIIHFGPWNEFENSPWPVRAISCVHLHYTIKSETEHFSTLKQNWMPGWNRNKSNEFKRLFHFTLTSMSHFVALFPFPNYLPYLLQELPLSHLHFRISCRINPRHKIRDQSTSGRRVNHETRKVLADLVPGEDQNVSNSKFN